MARDKANCPFCKVQGYIEQSTAYADTLRHVYDCGTFGLQLVSGQGRLRFARTGICVQRTAQKGNSNGSTQV